ncbi:MAG: type II secretion system minor pseudopilin GspI [Candidatus Omnitrophica bacterium]|nr:type II secretion system minor pseudopilin GspI [Candidatus Omnitrophota bacterium]
MGSKSNKGFTLIEVLVTIAIVSTAIIFIFRSFATLLSSQKMSQNMILACFLAEEKIFIISEEQKKSSSALGYREGAEQLQGSQFDWNASLLDSTDLGLVQLEFNVFLPGKNGGEKTRLNFLTLVPAQSQ